MSYLFKSDQIHPWAYCDNLFTEDECKEIIKIGNLLDKKNATLIGDIIDKDARICKTSWIEYCKDSEFIYKKITEAVIHLNENYFNFDLTGFAEPFQFTEYNEPDNFYGYHTDSGYNQIIRKLSVTLQLTPQDQYKGGDLELLYRSEPLKMEKSVGKLVVFPSYTLHRVLPVTKGTRHSLVGWVAGPQFK
jgi:PKHD-type hydroxylase